MKTLVSILFAIFVVIFIVVLGLYAHKIYQTTELTNKLYEKVEVIYQKDVQINNLNLELDKQVERNAELQLYAWELEEKLLLRELWNFESYGQLLQFLQEDATDNLTYVIDKFDCEDFAYTLSRNAQAKGYEIGLLISDKPWHMRNFTVIGNVIYIIEPQTDNVTKGCFID